MITTHNRWIMENTNINPKDNINNKLPEILAPCGKFDTLESAIIAGCDAVYLAGKSYGARAFAGNFDENELIKAIKLCHLYNVKVYVTVNTVIFENEIEDCNSIITSSKIFNT